MVKNLPTNARAVGSILGLGSSTGGGNGNPVQYSCLENRQRRLVGYSPLGSKELAMTKQLSKDACMCIYNTHTLTYIYKHTYVCVYVYSKETLFLK